MAFPSNPTNGQSAVVNSVTYTYSSTLGAWTRAGIPTGKSTPGTSPPASANVGDLWYNTANDSVYRWTYDGTSYYWIDTTGGSDNFFGSANVLTISSTVPSTSPSTGALVVLGGVGVSGNINANGNIRSNAINTTTNTNANLLIDPDGSGYVIFTGSTPVIINNTAASTSTTTGALVIAGGLGVGQNLTANTITQTRINPRTQTVVTGSLLTPDSNAADIFVVTALDTPATIAAPTGTPVNGQTLVIRIKDSGAPWNLSWNAIYRPINQTLPTTTVASKVVYVHVIYNDQDLTWDVTEVDQQA